MSEYIRLVSYLNVYMNDEKEQNCGFAKVDSRNGVCRVYINIHLPFLQDKEECIVHMFVRENGNIYGIQIGEMHIESGKGSIGISLNSEKIADTEYSIKDISGIYILTKDNNRIFASEWDDIPIVMSNIRNISEKVSEKDSTTENKEEAQAPARNDLYEPPLDEDNADESDENSSENSEVETEEFREEEHTDFWNKLGKRCVKMKPMEGYQECVKMKPNDLVCLPKQYWILGSNSFLLHGYYNYRYLIVARYMDNNEERYVLGVPGVFHRNEKIMAGMFGFGIFAGTQAEGENGYWCMNLK